MTKTLDFRQKIIFFIFNKKIFDKIFDFQQKKSIFHKLVGILTKLFRILTKIFRVLRKFFEFDQTFFEVWPNVFQFRPKFFEFWPTFFEFWQNFFPVLTKIFRVWTKIFRVLTKIFEFRPKFSSFDQNFSSFDVKSKYYRLVRGTFEQPFFHQKKKWKNSLVCSPNSICRSSPNMAKPRLEWSKRKIWNFHAKKNHQKKSYLSQISPHIRPSKMN